MKFKDGAVGAPNPDRQFFHIALVALRTPMFYRAHVFMPFARK